MLGPTRSARNCASASAWTSVWTHVRTHVCTGVCALVWTWTRAWTSTWTRVWTRAWTSPTCYNACGTWLDHVPPPHTLMPAVRQREGAHFPPLALWITPSYLFRRARFRSASTHQPQKSAPPCCPLLSLAGPMRGQWSNTWSRPCPRHRRDSAGGPTPGPGRVRAVKATRQVVGHLVQDLATPRMRSGRWPDTWPVGGIQDGMEHMVRCWVQGMVWDMVQHMVQQGDRGIFGTWSKAWSKVWSRYGPRWSAMLGPTWGRGKGGELVQCMVRGRVRPWAGTLPRMGPPAQVGQIIHGPVDGSCIGPGAWCVAYG